MIKLTDILNESPQSDKLSKEINKSITKIDDSMSYVDFAHSVAKVLRDEYGSHLYDKFIMELKKKL
jgi:ribonuclease HII